MQSFDKTCSKAESPGAEHVKLLRAARSLRQDRAAAPARQLAVERGEALEPRTGIGRRLRPTKHLHTSSYIITT